MKYTIDPKQVGWPIFYLSPAGLVKQIHIPSSNPGEACDKFEKLHSGAKYVSQETFDRLCKQAESERERLALWNEWAAQ